MATAKKLASGSYRCLVYVGKDTSGKRIYKSFTHPDKRKCERIASEYADSHRQASNKYSLISATKAFIDRREATLSPATIRGYKNILRLLKEDLSEYGEMPISSLNRDVLQTLVDSMVKDGIKPKTISNRIGLIMSVLKESDIIVPTIILPKKQKAELRIPETEEVQRIIAEAKGTEMEIPVLLACFGPMRRSEIVALTMNDISGNSIHVCKAVVMDADGKNVTKGTKTYDSDRYILMPSEVMDKIRKQGYITKIKDPQHITQRFEHIVKRAGCEGVRFHDLRHWCCSYLHACNVPEQYILERGGWSASDGAVMRRVYRHSLVSEKDQISKSITDRFGAML